MIMLCKKKLALIFGAIMLGSGMSAAHAQVSPDSLGQALIYPYFTALNGWNTFIHVINTSSTLTVAAKVRFRAAVDSADLLDFIVVLSPSDVWTGVIETQSGTVGFRPTDNTCTVPNIGKGGFMPFNNASSEGYVEVIMMGASPSTAVDSVAVNAKHDFGTGLPKNCDAVANAFASPASMSGTAAQFTTSLLAPTSNVLTGKYDLANVGLGQSGAGRATALANFAATGSPYRPATGLWSQSTGDWDHPTLAESGSIGILPPTTGLSGLQLVNGWLSHATVINEWVLNPNLGELSSWVVTFPTKKLTVDAFNAINALGTQTTKLLNNFSGCQTVAPLVYNREEKPLILPSPGTSQLCNEVNVVNFKNGLINSSSILGSDVAVTLDTSALGSGVLAGWLQLGMPNTNINTGPAIPNRTLTQTTLTSFPNTNGGYILAPGGFNAQPSVGRPVLGFNITARTTPSDSVLYEHAYRSF